MKLRISLLASTTSESSANLSFSSYSIIQYVIFVSSEKDAQNVEDILNRSVSLQRLSQTGSQWLTIDQFHVNVIGVVHTINAFMSLLQAGQTKKVITITSGAGDLDFTLTCDFSESAPYSVSKAALNLAIGKYAVKYKSEGFIFLSISPGMVNTAVAPRKFHAIFCLRPGGIT